MITLNSNDKIALVCRGGPENGPFSAMAARIISERLNAAGLKISGIYTCSGSTPTALLGCTGEFAKLCGIWANLRPEDIVGKVKKHKTVFRVLKRESILPSDALGLLIERSWDLDKIFSLNAIPIKFPAVDVLSNEYIIFSNKKPRHKKWFKSGALGTMGLVPFLPPQMVYDPVEADLISPENVRNNALLLIDGGYKGNMLLEEAQRDGFNVIFLIDVHSLKPTVTDINDRYYWPNLTRSGFHILSNANDIRQFQLADRINEEIRVKNELLKLVGQLPDEPAQSLRDIISRMNEGRLKLGDKIETAVIMVSNEEYSTLFNFANFKMQDVIDLLYAGEVAGTKVMEELGF